MPATLSFDTTGAVLRGRRNEKTHHQGDDGFLAAPLITRVLSVLHLIPVRLAGVDGHLDAAVPRPLIVRVVCQNWL